MPFRTKLGRASRGNQGSTMPSTSKGVHRPSPFAAAGANAVRAPTTANRFQSAVKPESVGEKQATDVSSTSGGNQSPGSSSLVEKVNALSNELRMAKRESEQSQTIINGLKRNLDHLTVTGLSDKRTIGELRRTIDTLKGVDQRPCKPPDDEASTTMSVREKKELFAKVDQLKEALSEERSESSRKMESLKKVLKESQHTNDLLSTRVQQFERDLASKSSAEVTFKKQMETVSAHAKRTVDENRRLQAQLTNSDAQAAQMKSLSEKVEELERTNRQQAEQIDLLQREGQDAKDLRAKLSGKIEYLQSELDSAHTRRKRAMTDLSSNSAHLAQARKHIEDLTLKMRVDKEAHEEQMRLGGLERSKLQAAIDEKIASLVLVDKTNDTLRLKTSQLETEVAQLEAALARNAEKTPSLEQRVKELMMKYEIAVGDRDMLARELDEHKHSNSTGMQKLRETADKLEKENANLKGAVKELHERLSELQDSHEKKLGESKIAMERVQQNAADGVRKAHIQVEEMEKRCDQILKEIEDQRKLNAHESDRANKAMEAHASTQRDLKAERNQTNFLQKQIENHRATSASETQRADQALTEAVRCRERYQTEHERATGLTNELSELRHAHLKLSEKLQALALEKNVVGENHGTMEKERDLAKAALAEVKERCEHLVRENTALEERLKTTLDLVEQTQVSYNKLAADAANAEENARLATLLKQTEKELRNTLAKLMTTEEASESAFTCLACMELFDKPITCIPCGHSFCMKCIDSYKKNHPSPGEKDQCPECVSNSGGSAPAKVDYFIANELLENLSSRFVFRKQALSSLVNMVGKLK